MENKINQLIKELRLRIKQLDNYPEDSYLIGVANVAKWLFSLREFKSVFDSLEKQRILETRVLDKLIEKLFKEIKKTWEELKPLISTKFLKHLESKDKILFFVLRKDKGNANFSLLLNEQEEEFKMGLIYRILLLEEMVDGSQKFNINDIYQQLRFIIEQAFYYNRQEVLKKGLIQLNSDKQTIKEFAPVKVYNAFLKLATKESEIKNRRKNEITPLNAYKYLRQLLFLQKEEDWKWQFDAWQKVFGREFYTPRLYSLADFLYSKSGECLVDTEFFYWSGYNLNFKLSSGGLESISFGSNSGLNMYYLMNAFVEGLRLCGKREGDWFQAYVSKDFLKEHIKKIFNKKVDNIWIKNTKGNLIKKIPDNLMEDLIKIGNFDRRRGGYYFALKIPS